MAQRFVRLSDAWNLRGWSDVPAALVDRRTSRLRELTPEGLEVARACDGRTDLGAPGFLPQHHARLERYLAAGIAEECAADGPPPPAGQLYRRAANPLIWAVTWSITGRCNLRCRHCYMEAPQGRYGEPSTDEVLALVDQFARANVLGVILTGGEPLLRRDLPDVIDAIVGRRMRVNEIVTNGCLLDEPLLGQLEALHERPLIKISFDGCGAHDAMRGVPGSEARALAAIALALEAGFRVAVLTSVDALSAASMPATYEAMKALGAPYWLVGRPQATGGWCGSRTGLSFPAMAKVCEDLLRRWLADGRPFWISLKGFYTGGPPTAGAPGVAAAASAAPASAHPAGAPGAASASPAAGRGGPGTYTPASYECQALREKPYLLPDGTLIPCQGYAGTSVQDSMPNLRERELSDVWTDSALRDFIEVRKERVLANEPECAACAEFSVCGAGCRAYALTDAGELFVREPDACELWRGGYRRRFAEIAAS